ncbi:MAG: sigma 54-interacting transcriptional regulator, partial [Sinobacteraceae bacterium]|nr:sigma 54-interacting transcriptional regulator [Nevskiaceae bacterium]
LYARRGGAEAALTRVSVPPRDKADTPRRPQATTFVLSPELEAEIRQAVKLLDADIPILLQGETGTGKEVVARELHRRSTRGRGRFVAINCAALPESLIESELFGYAPGAFTGARREGQAGLLRQANGGTLFLDEIGDMALGLQTRLLRVLQEREVTPLGASRPEAIDIAVVAATHQNIETAVAEGRFRADLYYRIAQSVVELPPLRQRPDRSSLIGELWSALGGQDIPMYLHPAVIRKLSVLPWPGNVRQLVGTLRSLMVLGPSGGTIEEADLPAHLRNLATKFETSNPPQAASQVSTARIQGDLRTIESRAIDDTIASCNGNVAAAARKLGISRSTIYRRLAAADE